MSSLLREGYLCDANGGRDRAALDDERAGYQRDVDYRWTPPGARFLTDFGVALPSQPVVRYCLDWSERRHHLAGCPGRGLLDRFIALAWVQRSPQSRAVSVTSAGSEGIFDTFGVVTPRVAAP